MTTTTDADISQQEDQIFESMLSQFPEVFRGRLCRDGVPRPDIYKKQRVRVVFVFREANMCGDPYDLDQRAQLRDEEQRQFRNGVWRPGPHPVKGFWNLKVGTFCVAVLSALQGDLTLRPYESLQEQLDQGRRSHDVLFPFAFMQLKKTGGGATAKIASLTEHVRLCGRWLREQVALYDPDLIIGCGLGGGSPARLLRQYVLTEATEHHVTGDFHWWRYSGVRRLKAMLEFYHPSAFRSRKRMYRELVSATRQIATNVGLIDSTGR